MPRKDLGRRLAVAGVGIPLGILVIYLGVWPVAVLLSVVAALGAAELYRISEASGQRPFHYLGVPASLLIVLSAAWTDGLATWCVFALAIILGACLLGLVGAIFFRGSEGGPLASLSITVLGVAYIGATLSFGVHLRRFPGVSDLEMGWSGALILIFPLTVSWFGDTMAYFSGHQWGRRKLLPSVSPGKTVVGAIGGLLGAVLAASLLAGLLINPYTGATLPLLSTVAFGLCVGLVAQLGDLAESVIKRAAGVKDSGALFPGHGGVLDRFDSIFFALPVSYLLLVLLLET